MTAAGSGSSGRLRLLVVAYYFPPSGGAGVQRILKWVRYLPEHGVDPVVLTVRDGAFPEYDESLLKEIPDDVEVVRVAGFDPFGLYARVLGESRGKMLSIRTDDVGSSRHPVERLARWLRANVFVPDARVGWVPFAAARGRRLAEVEAVDAVLSSGPPHSVHLAAERIVRRTRLPWLADFRDPWTGIHYYDRLPRMAATRRLDARLEGRVLRRASAVSTVSPTWAHMLAEKREGRVDVIANGFDPADFGDPAPARDDSRFVIAHVGSLFGSRNPEALWRALAALRERGHVGSLAVRVVGRVGEEVVRSARSRDIPFEHSGYVSHGEAVREMRSADALLLSSEPQRHGAGHVPGKLFEYLATGNPVIGLGDPRGDAARILRETDGGSMVERDDQAGVERIVGSLYAAWSEGRPIAGARASALEPYSRQHQAGRLAQVLRRIVVTSPA